MEGRMKEGRASTPIPEDPFFTVLPGFVRAKDGNPIPPVTEVKVSKREGHHEERSTNQDGNGHGERPQREHSALPFSPSQLANLALGKWYAVSMTRILGPFDNIPSDDMLPQDELFLPLMIEKPIDTI
ncbi:hypothetical protein GCK32_005872 [Trichostrongylus colubriformis]|uniref:Uncharacterized protein n=1 Tax=Trichostrongylus colubriformis TaxID=6319 RepID=A0AAN8IP27_TRICO